MLYDPRWKEAKALVKELEPWQQHLLEAAQYIRKFGWAQRTAIEDDGRVCVVGALYRVCPKGTLDDDARFFRQFLEKREGWKEDAPAWNDKRGRTKEEVVAALESAAFSQESN